MTPLTETRSLVQRNHSNANRRARRIGAWCVALAIAAAVAGCEKAPPPVTDLSKAPWLDPQVQMKGLSNSDFRIRGLSADNLGNIGAPAVDAIPQLETLAKEDPEAKVRELSRQALEKIRAAVGGGED